MNLSFVSKVSLYQSVYFAENYFVHLWEEKDSLTFDLANPSNRLQLQQSRFLLVWTSGDESKKKTLYSFSMFDMEDNWRHM